MRTHRFVGATSREVLHKVKQALGDDALILSNRAHDGGIEVVALSASEVGTAMDGPVTPEIPPAAAPVAPVLRAVAVTAPVVIESAPPAAAPLAPPAPALAAAVASVTIAAPVAPPVAAAPVAAPALVVATSVITASAPAGVAHPMLGLVAAAVTRITASPSTFDSAVMSRPAAPAPTINWLAMDTQHTTTPVPTLPRVSSADRGETSACVLHASDSRAHAPRSIDGILSEIRDLKNVLQRDIAALASPDTAETAVGKSGVMHELLNAGFSARLSRQVADEVCAGATDPTIDEVAECLERDLWLAGSDEIISRGGVYALVGPTGVGKTTTVAKIAARAVVRFGASKVALLTTDGYRIGAHDQLRIYGRILSVPVHAIRDAHDLATVLGELKDRHLILIDTIGMSQRDRMVAEHAAMLAGCGDVKRLLLVNTTANARTLEQVVTAYRKSGVDGCILTKTDEAASLAPALDVLIRHQLALHYVTDGQRVPEDLQLPNAAALVRVALQPPADEAFDLGPEEMMFMAPGAQSPAAGVSHG